MKKTIILFAALFAAGFNADAQGLSKKHNSCGIVPPFHRPHFSVRSGGKSATISYDEASTMLMVNFSSNSHGSAVEVLHDGAQVADITANSGTTFSCILRDYGEGNYTVIVFSSSTVIETKNFTVK